MTYVTKFENGVGHDQLRDDVIRWNDRPYVPTSDATRWVGTWEEFEAAGGERRFNGDQTEIELRLPAPYKFSIRFFDKDDA